MQRLLYIAVVVSVFLMNTQIGIPIRISRGASSPPATSPQPPETQQGEPQTATVQPAADGAASELPAEKAGAPARSINLGIVDILLWLIFGAWLLSLAIHRGKIGVRLPPAMALLMPAVAVASLAIAGRSGGTAQVAMEMLKFIQYFVVGFAVYVNFGDTPDRVRTMMKTFFAALCVVVIWALIDYLRVDNLFYVSGPFGNMNVLGTWLALSLPIALAVGIFTDWPLWQRALLIVASLAGIVFIIPAAALAASAAAMLLVLGLRGQKWLAVGAVGLFLGIILLPNILRENHPDATVNSVAVYINDNHLLNDKARLSGATRLFEAGPARYVDAARLLYPLEESGRGTPSERSSIDRMLTSIEDHFGDRNPADPFENPVVAVRYRRWQAALNAIDRRPHGYGLGSLQQTVGQFYGTMPRFNYPTDEPEAFNIGIDQPDSYNQFLKLAVEMGLAGVVAFITFYLWGLIRSIRLFAAAKDAFARGMAAGVLSALVFLPVAATYSEILVRGVALPFVFIICCVYLLGKHQETA